MADYKGIIINNLKASGTLTPAEQRAQYKNAQYSLNTPEMVYIAHTIFGLNGYNCIEIGLNSAVQPPKSVTIEDCDFTGTLSNNAIIIFGTQDNAIINIRRCRFKSVSNMLRISNRTNASGVVINIDDCEVEEYDPTPQWHGLILFENYTDKTQDAIDANNRFSPEKILINIDNLTSKGVRFEPRDMASVTNTADENQIFIWCQDYIGGAGYVPAFDAAKLPTVYMNGAPLPPNAEASGSFNDPMGDVYGD